MDRATLETLGGEPPLMVRIATAEDSIISKLEWLRKTNETSERQWDDVTRLIRLLGSQADHARRLLWCLPHRAAAAVSSTSGGVEFRDRVRSMLLPQVKPLIDVYEG